MRVALVERNRRGGIFYQLFQVWKRLKSERAEFKSVCAVFSSDQRNDNLTAAASSAAL